MKGFGKMKAKDYLLNIEKIDMQIVNKTIEINLLIDKLKMVAESTTSNNEGERVQSSGSKEKMADAIACYTDLEEELKQYVADKTEEKNEILKTIESFPIGEYELLHKIYVQGFTLKEISIQKSCAYSTITSLHGYAMKRLQKVLNDREKRVK